MRLMKLRRTYLYFVSAAFILLAGCESDYENRYPFDNAAYIDVAETSSDNNVTFKKTVTQLDRELSAVLISPAKENIEVTFGIDPSLAATYNAKHDTKYAVLDESYYEFPERTATVEAGKSVSEPLTIHFKNLDQLDIDATQLLPVTIVSAGGGLSTLSGSQTVYYLVRRSSAITTAAVLTDNWIDVPAFDKAGTADCVNGLTAVTYEAIVRVHDFHYAGPTSSYIEEKLSTIMGVEQHLLLRIGDTNFEREQLQFDGSGSGSGFGKIPGRDAMKHLETGRWYHVACTYDQNTRTARIYVDGQIQSEVTGVGITTQNDKNCINLAMRALYDLWNTAPEGDKAQYEELGYDGLSEAYQFFIGRSYDDYRPLNGKIAEARVWSVARTPEQIWDNMYDIQNPQDDPTLLGYWKCNDASGNTVKDYSMYGNDGVAKYDIIWPQGIEIPKLNENNE